MFCFRTSSCNCSFFSKVSSSLLYVVVGPLQVQCKVSKTLGIQSQKVLEQTTSNLPTATALNTPAADLAPTVNAPARAVHSLSDSEEDMEGETVVFFYFCLFFFYVSMLLILLSYLKVLL